MDQDDPKLPPSKLRAVVLASMLGSVGSVQGVSYFNSTDPDRTREMDDRLIKIEQSVAVHLAVSEQQIETLRKDLIHLQLELKTPFLSPRRSPNSSRWGGGATYNLEYDYNVEVLYDDASFLSSVFLADACDCGWKDHSPGSDGASDRSGRGVRLADYAGAAGRRILAESGSNSGG